MDIFKNLPFLNKGDAPVETEADIRKARIQFHREGVRVGPLGKGAWRRQDNHALAVAASAKHQVKQARRDARKVPAQNYERAVKQHFSERSESALLRGQLQAVGLLPYVLPDTEIDPVTARRSVIYLIHRFADAEGTVEVTETLVRDSLQSALNRWESLVKRPLTKIPAEYVLPVQVAV